METKEVVPSVDENDEALVSQWENHFSLVTEAAKELTRQLELRQIGPVEFKALRAVLKSKLSPREKELLRSLDVVLHAEN